MRLHHVLVGTFIALCLCTARPAYAALGDELVAAQAKTFVTAGKTLRYREHDGVREYARTDGRVFAFTWTRRHMPAIRTLLGPFLAAYDAALTQRRHTGHNHLLFQDDDFAVQIAAYPRMTRGSIVLVKQLPEGVTVHALP